MKDTHKYNTGVPEYMDKNLYELVNMCCSEIYVAAPCSVCNLD